MMLYESNVKMRSERTLLPSTHTIACHVYFSVLPYDYICFYKFSQKKMPLPVKPSGQMLAWRQHNQL